MHQTSSRFALRSLPALLCAACLSLLAKPAHAERLVAVNAGSGLNEWLIQSGSISNSTVQGLDLRTDVDWQPAFDWLGVDKTFLNLHAAWLQGEHLQEREQLQIAAATLTGQWRWAEHWLTEAGIGVAHLSRDHYESIDLVSKDLFMLDFATGYALNMQWQLSLRYRHFSSAYTRTPNPGLDYAVLQLAYAF